MNIVLWQDIIMSNTTVILNLGMHSHNTEPSIQLPKFMVCGHKYPISIWNKLGCIILISSIPVSLLTADPRIKHPRTFAWSQGDMSPFAHEAEISYASICTVVIESKELISILDPFVFWHQQLHCSEFLSKTKNPSSYKSSLGSSQDLILFSQNLVV